MGYTEFWDLGNFLQGENFLEGEQKFERLSAPNFAMLSPAGSYLLGSLSVLFGMMLGTSASEYSIELKVALISSA